MAHPYVIPALQEAEWKNSEFQASLGYMVSSSLAWAIESNYCRNCGERLGLYIDVYTHEYVVPWVVGKRYFRMEDKHRF